MKILKINELNENLKSLINGELSKSFDPNCGKECEENIEDFKEFLNDKKEDKNLILNNIDDILLFIETGFDLSLLDNKDFLIVYNKLKEIELNIILLKLKSEYPSFISSNIIEKKEIYEISENEVVYIGEEVYLIKRGAKKTSKGYEFLVELLLSGTFSYINSIYIDIKNEGFFVLGNMN